MNIPNKHSAPLFGACILITTFVIAFSISAKAEMAIHSIYDAGTLIWTNGVNLDSRYHVEWAPSAAGPWQQSWQMNETIYGQTQETFTASVPKF